MDIKVNSYSQKYEEDYIKVYNEGFEKSCYSRNNWPRGIRKREEGAVVFLAFYKDKCVGQITLVNDRGKLVLDAITVLEEYRKKGVGSRLLEKAEEWMKKNKIKELYVELHGDCDNLFSFYQKRGYLLQEIRYRIETVKEGEGKKSWKAYSFINRKELNKIKKERLITDVVVWLIFKKIF